MTALVDTSFLVAITNRQDKNHSRALQLAQTFQAPLLVPVSVLPEACYLVASRMGHAAMRQFLQELVASDTAVAHITSTDLQRATEILSKYADSKLDFVDATIVALAEREQITQILTFDRRDFSIIRPQHCPYFDLLP
jgi:hypothetical protein